VLVLAATFKERTPAVATIVTPTVIAGHTSSADVFIVGNVLLMAAGLGFWRRGAGVWRLFGVALAMVPVVWVGGGIILGGCESSDCGVVEDVIYAGFFVTVATAVVLAVVGVSQKVRRRT
jgi:hypothetical protein